MDQSHVGDDLDVSQTLITPEQIQARLQEMAAQIEADYTDRDLLIVGVLKGAVMVVADLSRAMTRHLELDWMAV